MSSNNHNLDILGESVRILEKAKRSGTQHVYLSPENSEILFASLPKDATNTPAIQPSNTPKPHSSNTPAIQQSSVPPPRHTATITSTGNPALDQLAAETAACSKCSLCEGRTKSVFGEGTLQASLMFIGEGPGQEDNQTGRPFAGPSGELLNKMIGAMQFKREEVYITCAVKCHAPRNRLPTHEEAITCLPYLKRQIDIIRPKAIVLLGALPAKALLEIDKLDAIRGQWQDLNGIPVMPTFHPSFLVRMPKFKRQAWQDLQAVMKLLGKDPANTPTSKS